MKVCARSTSQPRPTHDRLDFTIAVTWDVKPQTKQRKQTNLVTNHEDWSSGTEANL